jgi:hypothetical protein
MEDIPRTGRSLWEPSSDADVVGRGKIRWLWSCRTSANLSLETRGGKATALIAIEVLLGKVAGTASHGCTDQPSSSDEPGLASMKEPSEGLTFERDEAGDLEFDSEPGGRPPKDVRAQTGRRVVADIPINSADVGLGPGRRDS